MKFKLFYTDKMPDPVQMHNTVSKGFGIKHPERINGYYGYFLFHLGEVWVSAKILRCARLIPGFKKELMSFIERFKNGDYGQISESDRYENTECRYLGGSVYGMVARYPSARGAVCFEGVSGAVLVFLESENAQRVRDAFARRRGENNTKNR